jgi:metal-responsive CopG/Arc/MetJ family transcriptional regulator
MASKVTGVSLDEKLLKRMDRLAKRRGLSRSAFVASLLERELYREESGGSLDVRIDGSRYIPADGKAGE